MAFTTEERYRAYKHLTGHPNTLKKLKRILKVHLEDQLPYRNSPRMDS